jgi:hypothetical protein
VGLGAERDREARAHRDALLHQPRRQPLAAVGRRGRDPADRPAVAVVEDPDGGGDGAVVGLEPDVHGRRLHVPTVELGIRALLLDDEDVHPQPAQPVDLERRQFGEPRPAQAQPGLAGNLRHGTFLAQPPRIP